MSVRPFKFLRFIRLEINDCGVFKGRNLIEFNRHRTLISGECGSGKTTIVKVMYYRDEVASGVTWHFGATPSVNVEVEEDPYLIKEYRDLIFLNGEHTLALSQHPGRVLAEMRLGKAECKTVEDETKLIFQSILSHKPWKLEAHNELDPRAVAMGERISLGFTSFLHSVKYANYLSRLCLIPHMRGSTTTLDKG